MVELASDLHKDMRRLLWSLTQLTIALLIASISVYITEHGKVGIGDERAEEKRSNIGMRAVLGLHDMMTERLVAVASEVARSRNEEHRAL